MPVFMRALASLSSAVVVVYLFGVMAAAPYYNWQYAKAHGFLSWVTFGQIVPTVKAIAWPLYGLNPEGPSGARNDGVWSNEEKENAEHFHASMAASQHAVRLSNDGDPYSIIDAATARQLAELNRTALNEARLVENAVLEKALPGMSTPFREQYERGLELTVRNIEDGDLQAALVGDRLHDEWIDWINRHRREVRFPRR